MDEFESERSGMVRRQIAGRGLRDPRLLAAFESVPRHMFVPDEWRRYAYDDRALPIGLGQTISQPYMVAAMTDLLGLMGDERVLEVGTGSGYQAAILSRLAMEVFTIEYDPILAARARELLERLGYTNIRFRVGDGSQGWLEHANFDGILVTAFTEHVPQPLLDQLSDGGRLIIPVGARGVQTLEAWTRIRDVFQHKNVMDVAFVPLRGEFGWKD
jgi:protein-L-isoaspartate(D-aspartate) O-methyltransferase